MKNKNALKQLQSLPLSAKINWTKRRIEDWFNHWGGMVYLSFSGGLDSTVLKDIIKNTGLNIPSVHINTTNELPEIESFIKEYHKDTIILLPKMSISEVIKTKGYPIGSKKISRFIRDLQNPTDKNWNTRNLRLTGFNQEGILCPSMKLPKKWLSWVNSNIRISEECCDILKKEPLKRYAKETKRCPMTGVMATESNRREQDYLRHGCSLYKAKEPISHPLSIWTHQDILKYIKQNNIPYSKEYGDIVEIDGKLETTGENRTGCMYCLFGVHLENRPNRFDRMKLKYPKLYDYCMNKLEYKKILNKLQKNTR